MRRYVTSLACLAPLLPVLLTCSKSSVQLASDGAAGSGSPGGPTGAGVGEDCADDSVCREGLVCEAGTCQPSGEASIGEACIISAECEESLRCFGGVCVEAGEGLLGDGCETDADCAAGLRCDVVGVSLQCAEEGSADVGGDCTTHTDCFAGLYCLEGRCQIPTGDASATLLAAFAFEGVDCEEPSTDRVRAYFEVPGAAGGEPGDFFRLPFPNDIRLVGGRPDLEDFPTPGPGAVGVDLVDRYAQAVMDTESGWGAYSTVYFRFSGPIDFDTFKRENGTPPSWVDITPDTPEYGRGVSIVFGLNPNAGRYICHHAFTVRRAQGAPMLPGHTYAVWLSTNARAEDGSRIERSEHLEAMLADETPSDSALADAHDRYAPLREYLADPDMDAPEPDDILNAAVFTVGPVRDIMAELAADVQAADVPTTSDWVRCEADAESPCPQAESDRACGSGTDDYDEYHALVRLPVFQVGTAPYEDSGGQIEAGEPRRYEQVCMALTVPTIDMPDDGWPLVVFAHGTAGSFRSHVRDEVAGALARATTPSGLDVPFAVLGIDQVVHGPRRGDSDASPNDLYANFLNPDAARGNPLQGAADQIALALMAEQLDLSAEETGGEDIRIDPDAIVFFAHSQGATEGSLALPFVDIYRAAVLSGNGASLMHGLLEKTSPVNVAAALPLLLGDISRDGQLPGGDAHPALTVVQHWFDSCDPLNFAWLLGAEPLEDHLPKHIFQTYGQNDTYSPNSTLTTFAIAAGMVEAAADRSASDPDDIGGLSEDRQPVPVAGNVTVDSDPFTLVVRQYAPAEDRDGHFVVFDVSRANADAVRFLAMAAAGEVPQVGE
jgi:hypothetical protein